MRKVDKIKKLLRKIVFNENRYIYFSISMEKLVGSNTSTTTKHEFN